MAEEKATTSWPHHRRTHGYLSGDLQRQRPSIYRRWAAMIERCTNPNSKSYPDYGGRGIKVCERWRKFEHFLADMGEPPPGTMLDRSNNDGDYRPGNCVWRARKDQNNNKRNVPLIEFNGEAMTIAQWAERLGLSHSCLSSRLSRGWPLSQALSSVSIPGHRPP